VQVSITEFGRNPAWNPNGRELFYIVEDVGSAGGLQMMAVPVDRTSGIAFGRPRRLFAKPGWHGCAPVRCYDVSPDGERFYFAPTPRWEPLEPVTHIRIVQNWVEELKAKVPSRSR
jgi:hypothetical protein